MTIDPTEFRVGDRVTIHEAEITEIEPIAGTYGPFIKLKFPSGQHDWFGVAEIATHTPKPEPIKVGDWVTRYGWIGEFEVLGLVGQWAWLLRRHGMPTTGAISDLTLCEATRD